MLTTFLHQAGLRSMHLHLASIASIVLCIGLWARAQSMEHDERENAERRAMFVGLWPPTLWIIGNSIQQHEGR
jgi:hypothetical protein